MIRPIVLLMILASSVRAATDTTLTQVLANPSAVLGTNVRLTGRVKSINYMPEIRDGASILSFVLTAENQELRVVTPLAATLARDDQVTVRGVLTRVHGTLELDASAGDMHVQRPEHLRNTFAAEAAADQKGMRGVPTEIIDTPLTIAVSIAAIIQAIFAIIAGAALALRARRFNVRLDISPVVQPHLALHDDQRELHLVLRLLSTGPLAPCLDQRIQLVLHATILEVVTTSLPGNAAPAFPLLIKDDVVLHLAFVLPNAIPAPEGTPIELRLRDAFSSRIFASNLTIAHRECDAALEGRPLTTAVA
jgi:hypothetical protein